MKQLIIPVSIIVALIAFFVIVDRKEFNRHDVQIIQDESSTTNRKSSVSAPETKPLPEPKHTVESKTVETNPNGIKSSPEKQPLESKSDGSKLDSDTDITQSENKNAPMANPMLSPEEAEISNQEAIRLIEEKKNKRISEKENWRHDYNSHLFSRLLLFALCITIASNLICLIFKRKKNKQKDLMKASASSISSFFLFLFLYSIIPYYYNFWSLMNVCLIGIVSCALFKYFDKIWTFNKRDIVLIPIVIACAWLLLVKTDPRLRDIPNTITLVTEANGLTYNGVACNNELIKSSKDFFANYKHITLDEGWINSRSYRAILNGKGRLTLQIPTELIETYDLCIKLEMKDGKDFPQGSVIFNDSDEVQWKMNKETYLIPLKSNYLYDVRKNCNTFFWGLCFVGAFVFILSVTRLIENILRNYFQDNQYAYSLLFLLVCAVCFSVNFKEILFIDNCPDLENFGSRVFPKYFSAWKPAIIGVWWKIAIFFSPLESWNASFALSTLFAFYLGMFLVGNSLIMKGCRICPYFLIFSCFNIVHTRFYPCLLVDQIVASHCILAMGLCSLASGKKKLYNVLIFLLLTYLTFIISLVRGESLSCAVPILIVFFSLTLFKSKKGWKRVLLSGVLGSIVAVSLFCSYKFILSPHVIHETPFNDNYSIIDNYFREAMGICFFSKDWDDLPEWYTEEAEKALDKTKFIERPHYYRVEYLPKVTKEEILVFWAHMVKKHPWTYLKVKWVGNQVQWRLRKPFSVPRDVSLDNDPTETGLSLHNFFKEGLSTCGIIIPSWLPQVSLLFLFVFTSLLLLRFNDSLLWIIWGIGTSGFLHNFAFFLISGAPNYRYIYWSDICGCISFFLSCLVVGKYMHFLKLKYTAKLNGENNNEAVCPNTLF